VFADPFVPPAWTRRSTLLLLALLALAAALQLSYFAAYRAREPLADAPYGDSLVYLKEAQLHFVQHADAPYFKPPLYAELLWALDATTAAGRWRVRFAQLGLGLVVLAGAFVLAQRRAGDVAGALALVVALAFAPLTFHETKLLDTTLALALGTAGCVALDRAARRGGWRSAGGAGVLLGLASISWAGWLPVALAAGLALLWRWRVPGLVFAAGFVLPVTPLLVHNARTGGSPTVGFTDGYALLVGNNPEARGTFSLPPGFPDGVFEERLVEHDLARDALGREPSPAEQRDCSRGQALGGIAAHPRDAAALLRDKLRFLVSSWELGDNDLLAREQQRFGLLWWARLPFLALLAAGLFGLALPRARPRLALVVPATLLTLVLLATYVSSRYRLPLLPFLAAGTGIAGAWLVERAQRPEGWRAALVPAALAAAPLLIAALLPLPIAPEELRASERTFDLVLDMHAARTIGEAGDLPRAAAVLGRSLADHPGDERARTALPAWLDTLPHDQRLPLQRVAFEAAQEDEQAR
jgi:hypothetical protein